MGFKLIRDLLVIKEQVKHYFKTCFKMAIHKTVQVRKVSKEPPPRIGENYVRIVLLGCIISTCLGRLTPISLRPIAEVNQWGGGGYLPSSATYYIGVCVCVCMAILRLAVSLSCLLFMSAPSSCRLSTTRAHVNRGTRAHVNRESRDHENSGTGRSCKNCNQSSCKCETNRSCTQWNQRSFK
jgi:hypothetical protein